MTHRLYTLPSGRRLELRQDDDPMDPREWDNLGTVVCFHRRYRLGDKHDFTPESLREFLAEAKDTVYWLPLYLLDHSGLTMSTGDFGDPWDSGQVGVILVERDRVLSEYGEVSPEIEKRVMGVLKNEVEIYDQYLRGNCWSYILYSPDGEVEDSCGGFFGSDDPAENGIYDQIGERPAS